MHFIEMRKRAVRCVNTLSLHGSGGRQSSLAEKVKSKLVTEQKGSVALGMGSRGMSMFASQI